MREGHPSEPVTASSTWTTVAAAILALQGLGSIFYSGFLPGSDIARVSVPVLGSASVPWVVLGILGVVAAFGVYRRRAWGRVLGGVSEILAVGSQILLIGIGLVYLVVSGFVIFVLWRRWPVQRPG